MSAEETDYSIIEVAFHHSVLVPYLKLDHRCGEDILIDRDHNDVCLTAADICVSCFHLAERIDHDDNAMSRQIRKFRLWNLIANIANTRKHYIRQNRKLEVKLYARFAFEVNIFGFIGYIETQIIGVTADGITFNVMDLIGEFINFYRSSCAYGGEEMHFEKPKRVAHAHYEKATLRFTPETVMARKFDGIVYRRTADGILVALPGFEIRWNIILDMKSIEHIGRWQLRFDAEQARKFIAMANGFGQIDTISGNGSA